MRCVRFAKPPAQSVRKRAALTQGDGQSRGAALVAAARALEEAGFTPAQKIKELKKELKTTKAAITTMQRKTKIRAAIDALEDEAGSGSDASMGDGQAPPVAPAPYTFPNEGRGRGARVGPPWCMGNGRAGAALWAGGWVAHRRSSVG
jgi:hypothetical protein